MVPSTHADYLKRIRPLRNLPIYDDMNAPQQRSLTSNVDIDRARALESELFGDEV
jgi:hypothetical protein